MKHDFSDAVWNLHQNILKTNSLAHKFSSDEHAMVLMFRAFQSIWVAVFPFVWFGFVLSELFIQPRQKKADWFIQSFPLSEFPVTTVMLCLSS